MSGDEPISAFGKVQILDSQSSVAHVTPTLFDLMESDDAARLFARFGTEVAYQSGAILTDVPNKAYVAVVTSAVNDVIALVHEVIRLDGRSAARTARALFESLIALCDVLDSEASAERYIDHGAITMSLIAERSTGLRYLAGSDLRQERRRLKEIARKQRRAVSAGVAKWGSRFRNQWSDMDLRTRAKGFGYESDYIAYKILSAPTHASAGALLGTLRDVKKTWVARVGPDIELTALAFIEGLQWFRALLVEIDKRLTRSTTRELIRLVDAMLWTWPEVRSVLRRADNRMQPKSPTEVPYTLAIIYRSGVVRWFHVNPGAGVAWRAEPPAGEGPDFSGLTWEGPGPVHVWVFELHVRPIAGTVPIPVSALVPDDFNVGEVSDEVPPFSGNA